MHSEEIRPEEIAAQKLLAEAMELYKGGNVEALGKKLRDACKTDPKFLDGWGSLGWYHLKRREYALAEKCYRTYLSLQPSNPEVQFFHATTLLGLNRIREAVKQRRHALALLKETQSKKPAEWDQVWRQASPEKSLASLRLLAESSSAFRLLCSGILCLMHHLSNLILLIYAPLVRNKMLPLHCQSLTKGRFSVNDYLSFLRCRIQHRKWPEIAFSRVCEAALISEVIGLTPGKSVVDVGTGTNPLPLYWALKGMNVTCTDPDPFVKRLESTARDLGLSDQGSVGSVSIQVSGGESLPFPNSSFDFWTSVSVVEHIPGDIDTQTVKEAARVLKPGGIAVLTTEGGTQPECWYRFEGYFGKQYHEEIEAEELDRLGLSNTAETIEQFEQQEQDASFAFLRSYDRKMLMERLVEPSKLELVEAGFIDRRFQTDYRWLTDHSASHWAPILQPIVSLLVYWSYRRLQNDDPTPPTQAATAYVILRKPEQRNAPEGTKGHASE